MSEIADVLSFLSEVVTTTLNFGVNVISTIFLVISAILPWRWSEIHFLVHYSAKSWKSRCLASLVLTMLDIVAVPSLLFGFISPMRFSSTLQKVKLFIYNEATCIGDMLDKRYEAIGVLFMTLFDLMCLPFGLITLFSPLGRQVALFIVMTTIHYIDSQYSEQSDATVISMTFFDYGTSTIIDIIVCLVSAPFVLVVFTTWSKLSLWAHVVMRDEMPELFSAPRVHSSRKQYAKKWNEFISRFREVGLSATVLALLDIVAVIPFLLAFASPLRHRELITLVFGNQLPHQPMPLPQQQINIIDDTAATFGRVGISDVETHGTVPAPPLALEPAPAPITMGESLDDQYPACCELRIAIIQLGGLALADFILYPMICVLWVTHYRYHCIASALTGTNHWGNDALSLIVIQFLYLLLDVFVFSFPMAMLFITRIRWQQVNEALTSPQVLSRDTLNLYSLILLQFLHLIVDALTLPFIAIVCCTYYRFASVVLPVLLHRDVWRRGFLINKVFFHNALLVVHDVVFLLPLILSNVAILSVHRLYVMYQAYNEAHLKMLADRERLMIIQENTNVLTLDALTSLAEIDFEIRCLVWINAISAFFDIPFLLLGLLTLLSVWRANELVIGVGREMNKSVGDAYHHPTRSRQLMIHCGHLRMTIFRQFAALMIDFAALIPFTITIVTIYKMPQMITDLVALYFERGANKGQPLFTVKQAQVTWKLNTDPRISMTIKRVAPTEGLFDVSACSGFQLQVMGDEIWRQTSKLLGSLITSVIKASLPLKLQLNETVGVFSNKALLVPAATATTVIVTEAEEKQQEQKHDLIIWMKLPFGNVVKRSTLLKKLKKFIPTTIVSVQVGCTLPPLSVNNSSEESKDVPVTYLQFTVEQLIEGLSSSDDTFDLPCCTDAVDYTVFDNQPVVAKVDRFAPIVMSSFLIGLKDFAHIMLLFALLVCSPPRFLQCLVRIFSSNQSLRVDIGQKMWLALMECEHHLLRLRAMFSPILNKNNKTASRFWPTANDWSMPTRSESKEEEFRRDCVFHLSHYRFQHRYILSHLKLLNSIEDDNDIMDKAVIESLFDSHDQIMNWSFARHQVWTFVARGQAEQQNAEAHTRLVLASMVCAEEHDHVVREMLLKRQAIEHFLLSLPNNPPSPRKESGTQEENKKQNDIIREAVNSNQDEKRDDNHVSTGMTSSNTEKHKANKHSSWWCIKLNQHTQSIIRSQVQHMISDWVGIIMLMILIITVVRIIPLLRDIKQKNRNLTYKSLFIRHFHNVLSDLLNIVSLITAWIFLCITIVGIPEYLEDFASHLSSWSDAADCAWIHVQDAVGSIWELFTLLTAFKTYRILGKSILYCLFLPGASIASVLGHDSDSLSFRFTIGMIVFGAVMAGAIVVGNQQSLEDDAKTMNYSFIGVIAAVVVIQLVVILIKHCSSCDNRERASITARSLSLRLSWDHVLGLLLGPIECLLLSSVILYFYWNSHGNAEQGQDNLSYLLFWRHKHDSSSSKGTMQTAVTIAGALVLLWAVLIAIPLAQGSNDVAHRRDKIRAVLAQPAYRTLSHFLSTTIGVWIIATLMRPISCIDIDGDYSGVMSTAVTSACGTSSGYGMGHASMAFLVYFLLTTSLVQHDFYEPRPPRDEYDTVAAFRTNKNSVVEFHSLYMLQVRTVQTVICALCFGLVGQAQTVGTIILAVILALSLLVTLLPLFGKACCNVASILSLRIVSYLAVAWTAVVCLVRSQVDDSRDNFSTEGTIYIGWAVVYTAAIGYIIYSELRRRAQWLQAMHESGVIDAIESLVRLYEIISSDFTLRQRRSTVSRTSSDDLQLLSDRIQQCDSLPAIVLFVKELERLIPVDRLSLEFMLRRFQWLRSLQSIQEGHHELIESNETAVTVAGSVNTAMEGHAEDRLQVGQQTINAKQQLIQQVMHHITILHMGFEEPLASSHNLSCKVLAAVLSYRGIPFEVSMLIHSYMLDLQPMRNALIFHAFPPSQGGHIVRHQVSASSVELAAESNDIINYDWLNDPAQRAARRRRTWSNLLSGSKKEYFSQMCANVSDGMYWPVNAVMNLPSNNAIRSLDV